MKEIIDWQDKTENNWVTVWSSKLQHLKVHCNTALQLLPDYAE